MPLQFNKFTYIYEKKRFQDQVAIAQNPKKISFNFSQEGKRLLAKGIEAAVQSSEQLAGAGKVLPLQGIVDIAAKTIHLGALTPRDAEAFVFNEQPLLEHKQEGLFETGCYSPRIQSYQLKYSNGPTAHQQLLLHVAKKA